MGTKGSVFLCWSGTRSLQVVIGLKELLEKVAPQLKKRVFHSPDIEKGARWFDELLSQLEGAQAGIVCMTAESLRAPWLHFESGALLRDVHRIGARNRIGARVFTYLHGVQPASLSGPLAQYQSTSATREDTRGLVGTLARQLDLPERSVMNRFDRHWPKFARTLERARLKVPELLPEFESLFKRKTFDEPVQECADQNWIARYDGARDTLEILKQHHDIVGRACPTYQIDLYGKLLQFLDSYVMAVKGLLVQAPPFALKDDGTLDVEPRGKAAACEFRRRRIKQIVSRILDPIAVPVTPGAAAFWLAETFEERKMFVHRCEFGVLEGQGGAHAVRTSKQADALFQSVWDLDRILGYLGYEHLHAGAKGATERVLAAAVIELERVTAQSGRSLMALHYALGALKATSQQMTKARRTRDFQKMRNGILDLTREVRAFIEPKGRSRGIARAATLDSGGQVRRTLHEIEELFKSPGPTAVAQARSRPGLRRA